jgi:hypothetical protein
VFFAYTFGMLLGRSWQRLPSVRLPVLLTLTTIPLVLVAAIWFQWRHWAFDFGFVLLICPLVILAALRITASNRLIWLSAAISFPVFAVHLPILEGMRELGFGKVSALAVVALVTAIIVWWTNRPVRSMAPAQV